MELVPSEWKLFVAVAQQHVLRQPSFDVAQLLVVRQLVAPQLVLWQLAQQLALAEQFVVPQQLAQQLVRRASSVSAEQESVELPVLGRFCPACQAVATGRVRGVFCHGCSMIMISFSIEEERQFNLDQEVAREQYATEIRRRAIG